MGLRILLLLLIIWAIVLIVRVLIRPSNKQPADSPENNEKQLLKCEYCGVHCPEQDAFRYKDYAFCNKEHLDNYLQYTDKPD
jgi:uncharacterized protein